MNSRSHLGKVATCIGCKEKSHYYVAILKNHGGSTSKHWFVCLHCYENDSWQQAVDQKRYKKSIQPPKPKTYKRKQSKAAIDKAWDTI